MESLLTHMSSGGEDGLGLYFKHAGAEVFHLLIPNIPDLTIVLTDDSISLRAHIQDRTTPGSPKNASDVVKNVFGDPSSPFTTSFTEPPLGSSDASTSIPDS